ncbi:HNH endonuclease [Priestia aryabhattai]|uniref:HNH endonuclease n=1 Tax=Priestia TaxID=2800373 RepID=UPI001F2B78F6|nr:MULTISPECIES: HNH endonuclease [Priestia]MED3819023.1 HNH endonuclease [Priestia aryabhattai]
MSIPKNINREHVIEAIEKIKREGIPWRRQSIKYNLIYEKEYYPPKYVLSIANLFANGEEYSSYDFSGGDETNIFLERLGFEVIDISKKEKKLTTFQVSILEPVNRSREYQLYNESTRDLIVYEYLFHSRTHRWLDERILGLNPDESRGYQAMGILHFIGLKEKHKGIFKELGIQEAIRLLEQQDTDFSLVIQCLNRQEKQGNNSLDITMESAKEEYDELKSFVTVTPEIIKILETEREQVIKARIGQSTFKRYLLKIQNKCSLCGVSDERFLVASHIKPWSQSNHQERLDINNGLLLCPNHDFLFDKGYISFDNNGAILTSSSLDDNEKLFLNINDKLKIKLDYAQQQYMKWHRKNKFK